jgi:hypothetical protein
MRGFCRRKAGELRPAAERRRIPAGDDRSSSSCDHCRGETAGEVKQPHRIDLEIAVQDLGVDFEEITKSATNGIVDQHRRRAKDGLHCGNYGVDLRFVGHVADIAVSIGDFPFERGEALAMAGKRRQSAAVSIPRGAGEATARIVLRNAGDHLHIAEPNAAVSAR